MEVWGGGVFWSFSNSNGHESAFRDGQLKIDFGGLIRLTSDPKPNFRATCPESDGDWAENGRGNVGFLCVDQSAHAFHGRTGTLGPRGQGKITKSDQPPKINLQLAASEGRLVQIPPHSVRAPLWMLRWKASQMDEKERKNEKIQSHSNLCTNKACQ